MLESIKRIRKGLKTPKTKPDAMIANDRGVLDGDDSDNETQYMCNERGAVGGARLA